MLVRNEALDLLQRELSHAWVFNTQSAVYLWRGLPVWLTPECVLCVCACVHAGVALKWSETNCEEMTRHARRVCLSLCVAGWLSHKLCVNLNCCWATFSVQSEPCFMLLNRREQVLRRWHQPPPWQWWFKTPVTLRLVKIYLANIGLTFRITSKTWWFLSGHSYIKTTYKMCSDILCCFIVHSFYKLFIYWQQWSPETPGLPLNSDWVLAAGQHSSHKL